MLVLYMIMKEEILANATYTTVEAAKLLNLNPQTVQIFIRERKIYAKRVGRKYIIPGRSLLQFLGMPQEV